MAELIGTDDADDLVGDAGADTLIGGSGGDTLTGGGGVNLFVVEAGDSPSDLAIFDPTAVDTITDFSPQDRLMFGGSEPQDVDSLYSSVAADYETAYDMAQTAFAGGVEYASIKVGSDVFVFAMRAQSVVRLEGIDPGTVTGAAFSHGAPVTGLDDEDVTLSSGADQYDAGSGNDTIHAGEGADTVIGGQGHHEIYGGGGDDSISDGQGENYLRGEAGDDVVNGGVGHDDINGNMGRDTIDAGAGDDWVRGGKDDDVVFGGAGNDLLFGDLGNDTVGGGLGDDLMQGGPGDDIVRGDEGADTLIGGPGHDTLDGGLGADLFVASPNTGDDVVIAFNAGEGDRVQVDAGAQFTVAQVGADTVITLADGGQMTLVGVSLDTLPPGWIFSG
ncbi:calcium-binding protein [Phenylobacterium sp.]|uniref:calcium-binding protein n=1 Tax=Phenylobacterium sp. TaxID=1871053 RepID=UPI0025FF33AD|nr:calcium-binding protein [Phenylobacterium sp.]